MRKDVAFARERFQLSERRACKLLGMDRGSYRYEPRPDRNAQLREALIELARDRPDECVIGVEVHTTGLAAVLEAGLPNVRVVDGDVLDFLPRLAPASLDEIRIWFPDPWPKQRQRHRRLIRPDVVARVVALLRDGGRLHLATDSLDYSLQMQQVCAHLGGGVVDRPPWRPVTRYESRGLAAGRTPVDLIYTLKRNSVVSPSTNS